MKANFNLNSKFFTEKYDFVHVSLDANEGNEFVPRVPAFRSSTEDSVTKRICVARNLEGALTAIPGGGGSLDGLLAEFNNIVKVYGINCEKLGIDPADIVSDTTLYEENLVEDAYWTEENWITKSFVVPEEDVFYINIGYWSESESDQVPSHVRQLADLDFSGSIDAAWGAINEGLIPSLQVIEGVWFSLIGQCSENLFIVDKEFVNVWSKRLYKCSVVMNIEIDTYNSELIHNLLPSQRILTVFVGLDHLSEPLIALQGYRETVKELVSKAFQIK